MRLLRMRTYCHYNRHYNGNIFFLHKLSQPANKQIIKNFNEPQATCLEWINRKNQQH